MEGEGRAKEEAMADHVVQLPNRWPEKHIWPRLGRPS